MSQTYQSRRRAETAPVQGKTPAQASAPGMIGNQSMEALMTGAQAPSAENLGHQVDLPGAIREKMESSFGADLSGVRLYESQAVADAGAQAITMGDRIGFAPGQLDFASSGGQALLGHELSHVVSQARGQVAGSGFLNDHTLEARADREGAMAAAGESVYSGPVTPLSASSVSAASGPMQAKKPDDKPMEISEPLRHHSDEEMAEMGWLQRMKAKKENKRLASWSTEPGEYTAQGPTRQELQAIYNAKHAIRGPSTTRERYAMFLERMRERGGGAG